MKLLQQKFQVTINIQWHSERPLGGIPLFIWRGEAKRLYSTSFMECLYE